MLNRDRFDYSTQEHFGICVLFSFAKAIDALSRHAVSFFDVMRCLYGFTQGHLKKNVSTFTKWQDLVTPMIMSWNEFISIYGKSMQIDDLNHEFLSKHLFKEVTKHFPNHGIICSHPVEYNIDVLKAEECAVCYPFHHGIGNPKPCHAVVIAYDFEEYVVDPNSKQPLPFNSLPVNYPGFVSGGGDCILLSKV